MRERERRGRFHNHIFFSLFKYATRRNSKEFERFKEIIRLNKAASVAFPHYYSDWPVLDCMWLGSYIVWLKLNVFPEKAELCPMISGEKMEE